jgi:hypothetical protein
MLASKIYCDKAVESCEDEIEKLQMQLSKIFKPQTDTEEALKNIRNRLTTTEMDLSSKVEKKDFDKVAGRVIDLPTISEFESFQIRIEKIVEKFK